MPIYVWIVKDKSGRSVVREITQDTIEGSKAVLLAEGCTELKLVGDEVMDAATAGFSEKCTVLGEEVKVTAEERVKQMGKPPPTLLKVLREGLAQSKGVSIGVVLLGVYQAYRGNTTAALLMLVALLSWIAFIICVGLPSIYYNKLHKAADWNRWTEVLDLVQTLKKLRAIHFIKVPIPELMRFRAKALVGLGNLSTALDEFRQCEDQPGCPSWLYKAFVAGLYDTAKQYDKALELTWQSIRENPTPVIYLDLANRLVRYKRETLKAREALEEAEKSTLSQVAKPFHLRCRGILAYLEGDFITAKDELGASLALMLKSPHLPFRDGHISVAKAYLSCVLAKQGDMSAARRCFDEAKEYLIATGEDELLAECQHAQLAT